MYKHKNCAKGHRTLNAILRCSYKDAIWVDGEGPYATISICGHLHEDSGITIQLHETIEKAKEAKQWIDRYGCGGHCRNLHGILQFIDNEWTGYNEPENPETIALRNERVALEKEIFGE